MIACEWDDTFWGHDEVDVADAELVWEVNVGDIGSSATTAV